VTLYAGNEENAKPFKLHTDFACHYSPVFKAAFNSGFIEGQYQEYRLDVDEEEVVRLLVEWFYTQTLNTRQPDEKLDDAATMEEDLILAKLWVLADKLLLPQMQNQVLDRVQEIRDAAGRIPTECLHYVYNNTPPGSSLRRWYVYECASWLDRNWLADHTDQLPHEMLIELTIFFRSYVNDLPNSLLADSRNLHSVVDFHVKIPDN
jgi:hypothetical protein